MRLFCRDADMIDLPRISWKACLLLGVMLVGLCRGFYLPGVAPVDYAEGESVELKANKLTSVITQLPYEYYSLPFCKPPRIVETTENLGEVLTGDRIVNTEYKLFMAKSEDCKVLCHKDYTKSEIKTFIQYIKNQYRVNWILDNLPAATPKYKRTSESKDPIKTYELGYALGDRAEVLSNPSKQDENTIQYFIHNHVKMTIYHHRDSPDATLSRVVGFEIEPRSVRHDTPEKGRAPKSCKNLADAAAHFLDESESGSIVWTYETEWKESDVKWAYRWDVYLFITDGQVHWISIINSLFVVVFLTGMIALIIIKNLRQDIMRYAEIERSGEQNDESGWKTICGDVFRPPKDRLWLPVFVGSGFQLLAMAIVSLAFGVLGFLSPANRGALLTSMLIIFVFMGLFAGYVASRIYKMIQGPSWKRCTFATAIFAPGVIFSIFFILNFFIWGKKSSGAIPFTTLVALLALWFGISVPLVFIGSYFGYMKADIRHPCRTYQIPRLIPKRPWYMSPWLVCMFGGILPFGAVVIELSFIFSSIWLHHFYYVFGFLFLVLVIMVITSGEVAIVLCYVQLCNEDYEWWWQSFLAPGASAVYVFLYSIFYFVTKLEIHSLVSGLLFFGYSAIMSFVIFLMTGTIGFISCLSFLHKIYSSIKVD